MSEKIVLREITYEQMCTLVTELKTNNFVKDKEIERLNNIINELEKWLEDMSNRTTLHISTITGFTMCLNKLQELKGEDK